MAGFLGLGDLFGGGDSAKALPPLQMASFTGSAPQPFGYTAPQAPTNFMPDMGMMGGAAGGAFGGINNLSQFTNPLFPAAAGIGAGMINSPYAGGFQAGAGQAGQMGMGAATNMFGAGGALYNTAFDPQQDLYNRTLAQITSGARAGSAARGLADTPWGAGVENQATRDFNIDWQNQQLQRQMQGGQAAANLQGAAAPMFMQAAAYPWQTQQQIGGQNLGTIGNLSTLGTGAAAIPQQQIQQYLNYLQVTGQLQQAGNQQTLQNYLASLQGQGQTFGQQQTAGFQDPLMLMQVQQQQYNQAAQQALAQEKQASLETSQALGGLGKAFGGLWGTGLAGGGTLGGSILGGLGFLSDIREKTDIQRIGTDPELGTGVYAFRYRDDPKHYPKVVGPIAQEVQMVRPDLVHEVNGRLFVGVEGLSRW
jgi:hypothetical protein